MTDRRSGRLRSALAAALMCAPLTAVPVAAQARVQADPVPEAQAGTHGRSGSAVLPGLRPNLVAYHDFEHPVPGNPAAERDQDRSGTDVDLVNGGAAMRVRDGAFPGSRYSIQTKQVDPTTAGNDDWKAGVYSATGVPGLHAFNGVRGASIWRRPSTSTTAP